MTTTTTRLATLLTFCLGLGLASTASAGVYVGNPIVIEGIVTDGSELTEAIGDLTTVTAAICGKSSSVVSNIGAITDLADGGINIELPEAEYCKIVLTYDGDLDASGDAAGGWSYSLTDEVFELVPNAAETAFELELTEISQADVVLVASE